MKKINDFKRMKNLVSYPFLTEEMEISPSLTSNKFEENKAKQAVVLEVGIDPENNVQHRLNLVISFGSPSGYLELSFYFNLTDKENTKITSNPVSIYDREIAKKYLPKDLIGKNIFMDKLKEMLKKLLHMETPITFFMETFENHTDIKQKYYYGNLVKIIMENGYMVEQEGTNPITKKYFWKFTRKDSLKPLTEEMKQQNELFFSKRVKDDEYWKRHNFHAEEIMEGINKERRNNG